MSIDRVVMLFAGLLVLLGTGLSLVHSAWWLALPGFVGLNLAQASLTGLCPLAMILKRLGVKPGVAFG